jgi:hypothetical protein
MYVYYVLLVVWTKLNISTWVGIGRLFDAKMAATMAGTIAGSTLQHIDPRNPRVFLGRTFYRCPKIVFPNIRMIP